MWTESKPLSVWRPAGRPAALLLMAVLHTAANLSCGWLLPAGAGTAVGTVLLAPHLAVQGRMWRRT
jgi:hypothetical protein